MHQIFKAEEDPLVLLEKIRGYYQNYIEEHPTTPGQKRQPWPSKYLSSQVDMNMEQALQAHRELVSDLLRFYFKSKLDNAHFGNCRPKLMETPAIILLCSQMKSYQV